VRLDCFHHAADVLDVEGCNVAAACVAATLQAALLTSGAHAHLYRAQRSADPLLPLALAGVAAAVRPLELALVQSIVLPRTRGAATTIAAGKGWA